MKRAVVDDETPVRDQRTDVPTVVSMMEKLLIEDRAPGTSIKRTTWAVTVLYPKKMVSHTHTFQGVSPKDLLDDGSWHTPDGAKRLTVEEVWFKVLSHLCSL